MPVAADEDLPPMSARVRRLCHDPSPWSNADIATWFGVEAQTVRRWRTESVAIAQGRPRRPRRPLVRPTLPPFPPVMARFGQSPAHPRGETIRWGILAGLLDRYDALPTDPRHRTRALLAEPAINGDVEQLRRVAAAIARWQREPLSTIVDWARPLATRFEHVGPLLDHVLSG
jgi:hypothetical protein